MTSPLTKRKTIDLYYLEHRAKVLDIAAFLDRFDRARNEAGFDEEDFRIATLRTALDILSQKEPGRAQRILELFSDPTLEPLESAAGLKGAYGAYPGADG